MKKSNCSECGSGASSAQINDNSSSNNNNNKEAANNLSYWTPQTHRRSNHRSKRHGHHHRKSEMVSHSMVYAHKQHQFYSPQLQRRKSEDYINYHHNPKSYKQQQKNNCETSDSSDDEIEQQQQTLFTSQHQQLHQLSASGAVGLPVNLPAGRVDRQQQLHQLNTSGTGGLMPVNTTPASRRLQYYGGVHPVYLPNSRSKAEKLQKMPLYHEHCQGCCQHQHHRMKTGDDDKRCIIS